MSSLRDRHAGLTQDEWWEYIVKHDIEPTIRNFCQPRLTDGKPLSPSGLRRPPVEREIAGSNPARGVGHEQP